MMDELSSAGPWYKKFGYEVQARRLVRKAQRLARTLEPTMECFGWTRGALGLVDLCMGTRSSSSYLIPPFSDPESVIRNRRRILGDPSLLLDFEEINMNSNFVQGPPPVGPPPQNHNGPSGLNLQMPAPDL
ncbi:hypothetical protein Tco_1403773 [Tanacetum coccineum]